MLSAFVDNALLFYGGVGSGKHFEKKQINRVDKLFRKDNTSFHFFLFPKNFCKKDIHDIDIKLWQAKLKQASEAMTYLDIWWHPEPLQKNIFQLKEQTSNWLLDR